MLSVLAHLTLGQHSLCTAQVCKRLRYLFNTRTEGKLKTHNEFHLHRQHTTETDRSVPSVFWIATCSRQKHHWQHGRCKTNSMLWLCESAKRAYRACAPSCSCSSPPGSASHSRCGTRWCCTWRKNSESMGVDLQSPQGGGRYWSWKREKARRVFYPPLVSDSQTVCTAPLHTSQAQYNNKSHNRCTKKTRYLLHKTGLQAATKPWPTIK